MKTEQDKRREPNIVRYMQWLQTSRNVHAADYDELWQWSTTHLEDFWESIWSYFKVQASVPHEKVLIAQDVQSAKWFSGARLNYAEHVFRVADDNKPALLAIDEYGKREDWSWERLRRETGALAAYLRRLGVKPGDRVVGYLPNCPEAIVSFLAVSSVGAVWSACNQDVPVSGVLSRFRQLEPNVFIATNGCRYAGRDHDRLQAITEIQQELSTLKSTVIIPRLNAASSVHGSNVTWGEAIRENAELKFEQLPFDHPLWVLYSSGTTGAPKGIVHGHGGILIEQYKFSSFHLDLGPQDRFFWHCSTSWVMWNVLVSALLVGSTIILYDGSPNFPDAGRLWKITQDQSVTVLGLSPAYLQLCAKEGIRPRTTYDLSALRSVGCTGSPIPLAAYAWMRDEVGENIPLNSTSGGTDIGGGFVGGCPIVPTYPGENSVRCLGVAAAAWNEAGEPVIDEVGELVITKPMPSMPIYFWSDPDGMRYRDSYFDIFPGVWRHGDWVTVTQKGSVIVHGRSDATLNRHGVRLGSAEIYQSIEGLSEIQESLIVGIEQEGGKYWMPLFVHLCDGASLNDVIKNKIVDAIRKSASPRHVPDEIIQVEGFPHTLTGKRLEVPIKRILLGTPVEKALNLGAIDRPDLIEAFVKLASRQR